MPALHRLSKQSFGEPKPQNLLNCVYYTTHPAKMQLIFFFTFDELCSKIEKCIWNIQGGFKLVQTIAIIMLILFALAMVGIALYARKYAKSVDSFLLGGRNIGAWMSAFAYGTSYFSAVIFIGYAGNTGWQVGIGGIWIGISNALIGCLLAWLVLAKKTRTMTHKLGASTMPEFFEARFESRGMKIYSALIIFIFLVPYCATVYKGLGYLFSCVFPFTVDLIPGVSSEVYIMFIIAALTACYLIPGGYVATAMTDFIQGIIMFFGVIIMVVVVVSNPVVGGLSEGLEKLRAIDPDLVNPTGGSMSGFLFYNVLLTSLGIWGLPQMIHKYYAIKDNESINKAAIVSTIFALVIGIGAYLVGAFGRLYLNNQLPNGNYDAVVPEMLVKALSTNVFTAVIFGIVVLLVLSASMSTLASIVLTSSSAIAIDLGKVIKPDMKEKTTVRLLKGLCLLFIVLSFLFASLKIAFIMQLMSFSWGVVAGCFIGPYLWGLYSKKTTKAGAWVGLLTGIIVVGGGTIYLTLTSPDGFEAAKNMSQNMGVIALFASIIVVPIVSKFTNSIPKKAVETAFDK